MTPIAAEVPAHLLRGRYQSEGRALAARRRRLTRLTPLLLELERQARAGSEHRSLRSRDPVAFVHRFEDPLDQELVALLAATLAFGNTRAIAGTLERVLEILGPRPRRVSRTRLARLAPLRHRWVSGGAIGLLQQRIVATQEEYGSLGAALLAARRRSPEPREALARWSEELRRAAEPRDEAARRGLRYLLTDPLAGSASKRLHLFLRWMVRGPDGIDLGLWGRGGREAPLSPAELIVPLDTHVHWLARSVGLLQRKDAGWKSAEEITWMLRGIDPEDPLRFDFPLAHLGISGGCRHGWHAPVCGACPLAAACRVALRKM